MTLTKYATLSFVTSAVLLVFGVNSDTFAQISRNNDSSIIKTEKNNSNEMSRPNKPSRKNINIKTQGKESAGRPEGFATDSSSINTRSNNGMVRARIVRIAHSQEKDQVIKTNFKASENRRITSSGLRMRFVSGNSANEAAKDLENNKTKAERTEKEVKHRTNTRQKTS